MASVWVARQRGKHGFEKLVAIKTILPKFAADIRFQEMFLDEARIASRIEHLNVAQILDLGEEHEILYLAMEYVDGDALSKLNRACQKKGMKIPVGVAMRVLADTCAGLHEAHELKDPTGRPLEIVHRDVSPHNILLSTKGIAKLIDFGIAKARSRVGTDTNSGVLKGKIQYMAPEQALGRSVDRRADVWAVGAILYHLLAGKPPYEGDNQLATLHLLGSGRPPVPLPPSVHPAITGIVRKALAHQPEGRYETASALREAIEDAMIEAMVPTTTADAAAFGAEHLAERAERRRNAIDLALAAAAERKRVEDLLRPTADRPSITGVTPHSSSRPVAAPVAPSTRDSVPVRGEMTMPEVPVAKAPGFDAVARLTARVSENPPNAQSYATLGSAALESSPQLPQQRSRKGAVVAVGIIAAAAIGATIVSFTMFRGGGAPASAGGSTGGPASASVGTTAPGDTAGGGSATTAGTTAAQGGSAGAAAGGASPGSSVGGGAMPMLPASALPKVPSRPAWTPPPRWAPPPTQAAPAATPPPKPKPTKVDDGF